jgi:subtilisin family serine protease
VLATLRAREDVLAAFEAPKPELPVIRTETSAEASDSCPIQTPSYRAQQGYLDPAPGGINAPAAWKERGGRGDAVWFADIEGAWNAKHEDLPTDRIHAIGRPMRSRDWEMHGTAVLGEVVSRDNNLGMLGIAPDVARVVTSSVTDVSAAAAIDLAQAELRPGDVLLIELHAIGPRGRFLPMEYWDDVFDVIQIASARGVVVIEAAGNGAEDLDHEAYKGKLDRRVRDSGAIMVGAGAPALKGWTDRSRLDFSNFGTRVDVQGWGRMVATNDYGDLQGCDATTRKYTNQFAGTSSASPIVAGAVLLVESIIKTEKKCALPPKELRKVLIDTGSPQTDGPHGSAKQRIGPRPDLVRAIDRARAVPCATDADSPGP